MDNSSINVTKPICNGIARPWASYKDAATITEAEDLGTGTDKEMTECTPRLPEWVVLDTLLEGPGSGSLTIKGSANSSGGSTLALSYAGEGSSPYMETFSVTLIELAKNYATLIAKRSSSLKCTTSADDDLT